MDNYVERIINELPIKLSKSGMDVTLDGNNCFEKGERKRLGKKETEEFHTSVVRGIFVSKRAGMDIHQTFTLLSTIIKEPNETGWQNLVRMIKYLNEKNKNTLL